MSSLISFIKGSYTEFRDHVEWPKGKELQDQVTIVAVGSVILALFTFGVDTLFSTVISNIYTLLINLIH